MMVMLSCMAIHSSVSKMGNSTTSLVSETILEGSSTLGFNGSGELYGLFLFCFVFPKRVDFEGE